MVIDGGKARRACLVLRLAAALLLVAGMSAASDIEALRAATVKVTVNHRGGTSSGAGIILCQHNGRVDILTAKHVVTGLGLVNDSGAPTGSRFDVRTIEVAFYRDDPFPVRVSPQTGEGVVRSAEYKDLALLTLTGIKTPLRTARLGSSSAMRAGAGVESVGHLDVDWDWAEGSVRTVGEFIRHSLAIDHGYSGGPLYNQAGEVVGVNLQKYRGVARAMPIEEAMLTVQGWVDPQCLEGTALLPPLPPPPVSESSASAPTPGTITASGVGYPPAGVAEPGRRQALARRAAKLDAVRNLAEAIRAEIRSRTDIVNLQLREDEITAQVDRQLSGVFIVEESITSDGGVEITVGINVDEELEKP